MKAPIEFDVGSMLENIIHIVAVCLVFLLGTLNQQIQYFYMGLILDTCLGAWVSYKAGTFSKDYLIAKTIEKFILYTILIIAGHVLDMVAGFGDDQVRKAVMLGLLIKETPSFLDKFKKMGYKREAEVFEKVIRENIDERGGTNEDGQ
ncbi:MAG TPA: phage holin family protein [Pseudothermotoga sp.]